MESHIPLEQFPEIDFIEEFVGKPNRDSSGYELGQYEYADSWIEPSDRSDKEVKHGFNLCLTVHMNHIPRFVDAIYARGWKLHGKLPCDPEVEYDSLSLHTIVNEKNPELYDELIKRINDELRYE